MQWNEIREYLSDYIYGEAHPAIAREIDVHLQENPEARRDLEELRAHLTAYRDIPRPAPPSGAVAKALEAARAIREVGTVAPIGSASRVAEARAQAEPESVPNLIRVDWRRIVFSPLTGVAAGALLVVTAILAMRPGDMPSHRVLSASKQQESRGAEESAGTAKSERHVGFDAQARSVTDDAFDRAADASEVVIVPDAAPASSVMSEAVEALPQEKHDPRMEEEKLSRLKEVAPSTTPVPSDAYAAPSGAENGSGTTDSREPGSIGDPTPVKNRLAATGASTETPTSAPTDTPVDTRADTRAGTRTTLPASSAESGRSRRESTESPAPIVSRHGSEIVKAPSLMPDLHEAPADPEIQSTVSIADEMKTAMTPVAPTADKPESVSSPFSLAKADLSRLDATISEESVPPAALSPHGITHPTGDMKAGVSRPAPVFLGPDLEEFSSGGGRLPVSGGPSGGREGLVADDESPVAPVISADALAGRKDAELVANGKPHSASELARDSGELKDTLSDEKDLRYREALSPLPATPASPEESVTFERLAAARHADQDGIRFNILSKLWSKKDSAATGDDPAGEAEPAEPGTVATKGDRGHTDEADQADPAPLAEKAADSRGLIPGRSGQPARDASPRPEVSAPLTRGGEADSAPRLSAPNDLARSLLARAYASYDAGESDAVFAYANRLISLLADTPANRRLLSDAWAMVAHVHYAAETQFAPGSDTLHALGELRKVDPARSDNLLKRFAEDRTRRAAEAGVRTPTARDSGE